MVTFVVRISISVSFVQSLGQDVVPLLYERVQLAQAGNHFYFGRILRIGYLLVSSQDGMKASKQPLGPSVLYNLKMALAGKVLEKVAVAIVQDLKFKQTV